MNAKQPYTKPVVFRVELDAQQAILTACSLATMNAASGAVVGCRGGGFLPCKGSAVMFGSDSSGRPS